jgi:hypothetical protein
MAGNGQLGGGPADGRVLDWPGRVLAAADLERHLNGHRALLLGPRTVITPLASEHLRARGIAVTRRTAAPNATESAPAWGVAQERPDAQVQSAVRALERDGVSLKELVPGGEVSPCRWARAVAECVATGQCAGGVVFCQDPGLVCCVANKVGGLRAAAAATVAEAGRARLTLAANLLAVPVPGRTFFELRQILRTVCRPGGAACPAALAGTLTELDGHAHR